MKEREAIFNTLVVMFIVASFLVMALVEDCGDPSAPPVYRVESESTGPTGFDVEDSYRFMRASGARPAPSSEPCQLRTTTQLLPRREPSSRRTGQTIRVAREASSTRIKAPQLPTGGVLRKSAGGPIAPHRERPLRASIGATHVTRT